MPEPRWDVRNAAAEMWRSGTHGLSASDAYASEVDRHGAHEAALHDLMTRFGVRKETAKSALSWALAQARGEQHRSERTPGSTSGTAPNAHFLLPEDVLAYLQAHKARPGGMTRIVVDAVRQHMATERALKALRSW